MRALLVPSLFALAGIAVLLWLGVWQMQRLAWKQGLTEQIRARLVAPPIDLASAHALFSRDPDAAEYTRVALKGHFLNAKEIHLYGLREKRAGWLILTPFSSEDGTTVLVNRGFVPRELKQPSSRKAGLIEGSTEVRGLLRRPQQQPNFAPANKPGQNRWFWQDLPAMTAKAELSLAPFIIDAEASPARQSWPKGGATRVKFENRHLEYALTWFGLAATLAVVYAFFAWTRIRQSR